MLEEVFIEIMGCPDGDCVTQTIVLAEMKPAGWQIEPPEKFKLTV